MTPDPKPLHDDINYYSDRYLNVWKYFYQNNFDLLDNIFPEVMVVSTSAKKTRYSWACRICGYPAEFENMKQELHPKDEPTCYKCYYEEEYFDY